MKLMKIFAKGQPSYQGSDAIIRDEMMFLLERNERRFTKQLLAHLLDEGCNLPIIIAKPRFYELMIAGLLAKATPSAQKKFTEKFDKINFALHEEFFDAMLFFKSHLNSAENHMAVEVTKSIDTIKTEWQLDDLLFQEELDHFENRLQAIIDQICPGVQDLSCTLPLERVRRRLYITLTTSLLRHLKERKPFQEEFGSIPEVLNAMQKDHTIFCHFMAFCKARTPYFNYIASRTFWRTLETLRLELKIEN